MLLRGVYNILHLRLGKFIPKNNTKGVDKLVAGGGY